MLPAPALKLDILVCFFAYGGNGGVAMQLPSHARWWATVFHQMKSDPRIGRVGEMTLSDTPITMTRNKAVRTAKEGGFHLLLMLDSDNEIDLYANCGGKPFWDSSFEFVYERARRGLPTVIAAPYCGPPPHPTKGGEENVYVFRWTDHESDVDDPGPFKIEAYARHDAALMQGIHPAAALPTGCCMFTMDCFDLLPPPYFAYEWKDEWQDEKGSTEDVMATRNISLAGHAILGQEVVFCNWDAWAGHHKPKCVGKPKLLMANHVNEQYTEALKRGINSGDRINYVNYVDRPYEFTRTPAQQAVDVGEKQADVVAEHFEQKQERKPHAVYEVMLGPRKVYVGETPREEAKAVQETLQELRDLTAEIAKKKKRPLRVVDVKSVAGETAIAMSQGFSEKFGGMVYCFDQAEREKAVENAGDLNNDVVRLMVSSAEECAEMEPQDADIVFLGGNNRNGDLPKKMLRHVAAGGVLCGLAPFKPEGIEVTNGGRLWTAKGSRSR